MNKVIPFDYQGEPVRFNLDGWLHATKVADRFGKRLDRWMENAETLEYMRALDEVLTGKESKILDTRNSGYVKTSKARADRGGGTWLHPKLAVAFARWCDAKFSVWCDMRIDALLRGDEEVVFRLDRACRALEDSRKKASTSGRNLSLWRRRKSDLEHEVDHWRNELQLTLGFDVDAASA